MSAGLTMIAKEVYLNGEDVRGAGYQIHPTHQGLCTYSVITVLKKQIFSPLTSIDIRIKDSSQKKIGQDTMSAKLWRRRFWRRCGEGPV